MTRGIFFFAINNNNVNYLKIALVNALMCKKHMGDISVSVATSSDSLRHNKKLKSLIEKTFDKIIIDDVTSGNDNVRKYRDTQYFSLDDRFINTNRNNVYHLSPYDETLLIDVDYLIQDDSLNNVWGCQEDFLINKDAIGLDHRSLLGEEFRLNQTGIKMAWATVIYFRKTERAKAVFDTVSLIKEQWNYFKLLYGFGGYLYRNDFAFSIALHILGGFIEEGDFKPLPVKFLLTSTDRDHLFKVGESEITFMYNDLNKANQNHEHAFYLTKIKGHSVHVMNKLSLQKFADELLEIYK